MKKLLSLIGVLWAVLAQAQTLRTIVIAPAGGASGTAYSVQTYRNNTLFPATTTGNSSFTAAVASGALNLTVVNTGCLIAAGTPPPLTAPTCSQTTTAPSWITNSQLRYSYASPLLTFQSINAIGQLKFERVDGQSFSTTNPDGVPINSGTFYGYGDYTEGSYNRRWQLNYTGPALRLTAQQEGNTSSTYSYTVTPSATVSNVLLTGGSSTTTGGGGSSGGGGTTITGTAGYGGIFAANSTYQALSETTRPSGSSNGTSPWARSYIDNGTTKVGINLSSGGMIDYWTHGSSKNFIESYVWGNGKEDAGRALVGSWYAYPSGSSYEGHYYDPSGQNTGQAHDAGAPSIGWNPVEPGDYGDNPHYSQVLTHHNDGTTIYKKVQGMQWDLSNIPGQAYTETWLKHDPNEAKAFRGHMRVTMFRTDGAADHFPTSRQQEAPCLYTTADWNTYYFCLGQPYTNASLTQWVITGQDRQQAPVLVTEPFVAACKWGNTNDCVVMYAPQSGRFTTGVFNQDFGGHGQTSNPEDIAAGYVNSAPLISLDKDGIYDFDYALFHGSLSDARAWVYNQPRWSGLPEYIFNSQSRLGFTTEACVDQREKNITGYIDHTPRSEGDANGMYVQLPERWINGRTVPHLYWKNNLISSTNQFELVFKKAGDNTEYRHAFTAANDGADHVTDIDLSGDSNWNNQDIVQCKIMHKYDSGYPALTSGERWRTYWISYRNPAGQ